MTTSRDPQSIRAVEWREGACLLLDQTRLPREQSYLRCTSYAEVVRGIRDLAVRGAPAIGVAGAYGAVLAARESLRFAAAGERREYFTRALKELATARPTAVNLRWAIRAVERAWEAKGAELIEATVNQLLEVAEKIQRDDIEGNVRMAEFGASLLPSSTEVMTYCNTGDLATGGVGTAFGVLHEGFRQGKVTRVHACETRPVLQGLRLTAWELERNNIPFTLICDNMAATVMRSGRIGAVIVGADRVAGNGDVANKIGTYGLAVLAKYHNIPFIVAAPFSTFDGNIASGAEIPIEERPGEEILMALGDNRPPFKVPTFNPAFDVTPHTLIHAIVCEQGILRSPSSDSIGRLHRQAGTQLV